MDVPEVSEFSPDKINILTISANPRTKEMHDKNSGWFDSGWFDSQTIRDRTSNEQGPNPTSTSNARVESQ